MIVKYKCECMKSEAEILVPDLRPGGNKDNWLAAVRVCLTQDHRALSPNCQAGDYEYVHFPESAEL